jgi:multimeric flavodoxin WrbA
MDPIRVLGIYGGDPTFRHDRTLCAQFDSLLASMANMGAKTSGAILGDHLARLANAQPGKQFDSRNAELLGQKVMAADVLIIATPVHWRKPSLLTSAFIDHVLAPLEWGGIEGNGYECWGKVAATLIVCDDDGATLVASGIHDTLTHMGFFFPPWAAHHKNFAMKSSEDDWQNQPESLGPILLETAQRMRGFPSPHELMERLKKD